MQSTSNSGEEQKSYQVQFLYITLGNNLRIGHTESIG